MSVLDIEELWETDPHWIYRAVAAQQAETLAAPIRERYEQQRAKEQAAAAHEAQRAASREAKRERSRAMRRKVASVDGVYAFVDDN